MQYFHALRMLRVRLSTKSLFLVSYTLSIPIQEGWNRGGGAGINPIFLGWGIFYPNLGNGEYKLTF